MKKNPNRESGSTEVNMIDVGGKPVTERRAKAAGQIRMSRSTLQKVLEGELPKGDVLNVARTAGIMGAKKTAHLLPLCHPLTISGVDIDLEALSEEEGNKGTLTVEATVTYSGRTGVEMEALTACAIALLTIYDMAKGEEKAMEIRNVQLMEKSGGSSGDWTRKMEVEDEDGKR